MILISLGANLPSTLGSPLITLEAAMGALQASGVRILARSRYYQSPSQPHSNQPWFVNAVISVKTDMEPVELLGLLHQIESKFGRVRMDRNGSRVLDLDLLAYNDKIVFSNVEGEELVLPHPRIQNRSFILIAIAEINPHWVHPVSGQPVQAMISALPPGQKITPVPRDELPSVYVDKSTHTQAAASA